MKITSLKQIFKNWITIGTLSYLREIFTKVSLVVNRIIQQSFPVLIPLGQIFSYSVPSQSICGNRRTILSVSNYQIKQRKNKSIQWTKHATVKSIPLLQCPIFPQDFLVVTHTKRAKLAIRKFQISDLYPYPIIITIAHKSEFQKNSMSLYIWRKKITGKEIGNAQLLSCSGHVTLVLWCKIQKTQTAAGFACKNRGLSVEVKQLCRCGSL